MTKEFLADVAKLQYHLEEARGLAERVSKHDYTRGNDISAAEMLRTIRLCENDDRSVGDLLHWLTYIQRGRAEYRLAYDGGTGRFRAGDRELGCGSPLELYVNDPDDEDFGWNFGRVEHSDRHGGYYFRNESGWGDFPLAEGMRVAVR